MSYIKIITTILTIKMFILFSFYNSISIYLCFTNFPWSQTSFDANSQMLSEFPSLLILQPLILYKMS